MTVELIHNKKPEDKGKENDRNICNFCKAIETVKNINLFESWSNVMCNMEKSDFYRSSQYWLGAIMVLALFEVTMHNRSCLTLHYAKITTVKMTRFNMLVTSVKLSLPVVLHGFWASDYNFLVLQPRVDLNGKFCECAINDQAPQGFVFAPNHSILYITDCLKMRLSFLLLLFILLILTPSVNGIMLRFVVKWKIYLKIEINF